MADRGALIVINNQSAEAVAFVDFESLLEFDELVPGIALAIGHEPEGDFGAAVLHVMNTMSVPELVTQSSVSNEP